MTQENRPQESKKPEDRRREDAQRQAQGPRSSSQPSSSPRSTASKNDADCLPCEESRSLTGSEGAKRADQRIPDREQERRTAPSEQGRTGSTYGGQQAKDEMESEGGALARSEEERRNKERGNTGNRPGRSDRPTR